LPDWHFGIMENLDWAVRPTGLSRENTHKMSILSAMDFFAISPSKYHRDIVSGVGGKWEFHTQRA